MFYICKGCCNCCKGCNRCIDKCCKGCQECCAECDKCCNGLCKECCQCCESCCTAFSNCFQKTFSAPFSFCAFVVFWFCGVPFVLALVAIIRDWDISDDCDKPIQIHLLIEGICNFLNLLFCIYLCFRYGTKYHEGKSRDPQNSEEKNILQVTQQLILYDFVVCFYICLVIFLVVWTIIGSVWLSNLNSEELCTTNHGFLLKMALYNVIVVWIFLILGLFIFIYTVLLYACEDGSCTCHDWCRCVFLILSCGMCDLGKSKKNTNKRNRQPNNNFNNNNNINYNNDYGWIKKSKNFLGKLGIINFHENNWKKNDAIHNNINANNNYNNNMQMVGPPIQIPLNYDRNIVNPNTNNNMVPMQYINATERQQLNLNNPPQQYNNNNRFNQNANQNIIIDPNVQGFLYPIQQPNKNPSENIKENEEKKQGTVGQIKNTMKDFKNKLKKYF